MLNGFIFHNVIDIFLSILFFLLYKLHTLMCVFGHWEIEFVCIYWKARMLFCLPHICAANITKDNLSNITRASIYLHIFQLRYRVNFRHRSEFGGEIKWFKSVENKTSVKKEIFHYFTSVCSRSLLAQQLDKSCN